ncbi:wax synthase family protein [Aspergillus glaucus CBS 516.65]|uniref:Wax synthase domain-containing protein n=1 Tax=Aspergillus glaucus CBS 516.65 TaxID=1160497 RepID=A0A1L9VL25_ASPGL|nr:hypothetical protein ASPGLDRAFT_125415 [Aspergillus glaucus CBS 516.65]OJJ84629.1 hypothetical protein ASPGLDRAFT_125415 [Aspergillus glaucus CBS 516.65]
MVLTQLPQWLLIQATIGLAISYTPPNANTLRSAAAIVIIALATSLQIEAIFPGGKILAAAGPIAAMGWVNVLNGIELLLLSRVSYRAQVEWEKTQLKAPAPTSQLTWAFWMPYNYRRVRTPWQIKRLPCFRRDEPGYVPGRGGFLVTCAGKAVLCGSLVRILTVDLRYAGLEEQLGILWGQREDVTLLHRVLVQTSFMVPFAVLIRAVIVGVYSVMALSCVGLGISEPALWPPISGSLLDAWSIRRLWGLTWHQMLRTCLVSNINFVFSVLRIPSSSAVAYILRLVLVFALSGLVHLGMDLGFSVPIKNSGALHFFTVQAFGMMFEQLVDYVWSTVFGNNTRTSIAGRIVGYLWVIGFLAVTAPTWLVPIIKGVYDDGERVPLPMHLGWGVLLA